MGKKFDPAIATSNLSRALPQNKPLDKSSMDPESQFKRRYYNLETGDPLPLPEIEERIRRSCLRMDRLSVEIMLDLFFIHANWSSFYNRQDSFSSYMREQLPINRSYAYDIIKSVKMLIEYQQTKNLSYDTTLFSLREPIDLIGPYKLKIVAQIKDKDQQYKIIDDLLAGKTIHVDEILTINKNDEAGTTKAVVITESKDRVLIDGAHLLTFELGVPEEYRRAIRRFLQRYFRYAPRGQKHSWKGWV